MRIDVFVLKKVDAEDSCILCFYFFLYICVYFIKTMHLVPLCVCVVKVSEFL